MSGIARDFFHTIKADGTLWAAGSGVHDRLGIGDATNYTTLTQVGAVSTWESVSCGADHAAAIRTDGTLWAWGLNGAGQLGTGDKVTKTTPTQIGVGTTWARVACGLFHTVALKTDGTLWAWGSGAYGELGQGDTTEHLTPTQIGSGTTWDVLAVGKYINFAIQTDGTLWSWGVNTFGQLGHGDSDIRYTPTQVGVGTGWESVSCSATGAIAVKADGTLWACGNNDDDRFTSALAASLNVFTQVGSGTDWERAVLTEEYAGVVVALKSGGTVWACGANTEYMLGNGQAPAYTTGGVFEQVGVAETWTMLSMTRAEVYALTSDDTLYGWGYNSKGALGVGDTTYRDSPTQIATSAAQLFDAVLETPTFSGLAVLVTAPASSMQTTFVGPFEAAVEVEVSAPAIQIHITELWKTAAPVPSAYITFASDMLLSGEVTAGVPSASFSLSIGATTHDFEVVAEAHLPEIAFTIGLGNAFSVDARAAMPSAQIGVSDPLLVSVEAPVPSASFSFYREIDWVVRVETPAPSAAITLSQQLLDTFDTWAVNAAHGGHSVYTNYAFTSYFALKGIQYGVLDGNIYALTGTKDVEADIVSEAIFGVSNLGTDKEKRVDSVYPVVVSPQTTEASVSVAVDSGSKLEYSAPVTANTTKPVRCKISRGLSGRYWQIGIKNTDGDQLEVTKMVGVVVPLSRRT